jgi:hypothetical protein
MPVPPEITEEDLDSLDDAFAEAPALSRQIRQRETTPRPTGDAWFRDLLACLVDATCREYRHLRIGLGDSTPLVAWACRNLLELNIYTQYVLSSEANARRFTGERLAEGMEIFDAFQTWAARNDPALVTPAVAAVLNSLAEAKAQEEAAAPLRALSIRYLSAEAGLADEYANMSRVSAKLIHPSVFPVLAGADEGPLPLLRPALFRAGAGHGLEIIQAIRGRSAC